MGIFPSPSEYIWMVCTKEKEMRTEIKQGPLSQGGNTSAMRLRLRLLDSAAAASGKKLIHFVKEIV